MCEKYYECVFFGKKEKRKKKRRKLFLTRIVDLVPVWNVICVKTKQTTKKNSLVSKCLIFFNFSIHKNLYICILFWWRFVHSGWSMGDWFPYIRFLWMDLFWWLDSSKNRLPFFFSIFIYNSRLKNGLVGGSWIIRTRTFECSSRCFAEPLSSQLACKKARKALESKKARTRSRQALRSIVKPIKSPSIILLSFFLFLFF